MDVSLPADQGLDCPVRKIADRALSILRGLISIVFSRNRGRNSPIKVPRKGEQTLGRTPTLLQMLKSLAWTRLRLRLLALSSFIVQTKISSIHRGLHGEPTTNEQIVLQLSMNSAPRPRLDFKPSLRGWEAIDGETR